MSVLQTDWMSLNSGGVPFNYSYMLPPPCLFCFCSVLYIFIYATCCYSYACRRRAAMLDRLLQKGAV